MSIDKQSEALDVRQTAASVQINSDFPDIRVPISADASYASYGGSFSKLLEHNSEGVLTPKGAEQYQKMVTGVLTCDAQLLGEVELAVEPNGSGEPRRLLVNPQSAHSFQLSGADPAQLSMPSPPALSSRRAAVELLEVYGNMLLRDCRFDSYAANKIARLLAKTLTRFGSDYHGPKAADGTVTPELLFRGVSEGDLRGGYLSQFLLLPFFPLFPSGCAPFVGQLIGVGNLDLNSLARDQTYHLPRSPEDGGQEFLTTEAEFAAVQNGDIPRSYKRRDYEETARYVVRGRDIGGLVHVDSPYEAYYNALNILIFRGASGNPAFPYNPASGAQGLSNQADGHTMGPSDAYTLMAQACVAGFKAAWANKWMAHRRLRPEVMAARAHFSLRDVDDLSDAAQRQAWINGGVNPFGLHADLVNLGWEILEAVRERGLGKRSLLLSQMYPEGSPAHPAYPSGHATVAGACITVLKAFFDGDAVLPALPQRFTKHPRGYVRVSGDGSRLKRYLGEQLTVGGELDKLASNIAHGRDFGGVHYRADGDNGIQLGEEVALRLLQDHARTYPEPAFDGFVLTRRNGQRVRVTAEAITEETDFKARIPKVA